MGKGRQKRARDHRKSIKKRSPASLLPWIVISVSIIVIAYVGWRWISPTARAPSVGIVDQFYSQSPDFTDRVVTFLEGQSITYKLHKDAEVTVELYRNLPTFGYKLIILRVHAGVSMGAEQKTAMFTSQEYNADDYFVEQLLDQVGQGIFGGVETPVFTVSPNFVTNCMKGDFQNAIVVLSSCWGLHNTLLAEALRERGASSFIGWDERVTLEHTDEATLVLLKALINERLTINEAVDKAMKEVGPDQAYSSKLKYHPEGASSLKLEP